MQNQHNSRQRLPDITVEKLQACTEEGANDIEDGFIRARATVQVGEEGQVLNVFVDGIPENAPDLTACTRVALRNMAIPTLPLRTAETVAKSNTLALNIGNELANPAIAVEVLIVLGEYAAQHAGKTILYAVTIQVLSALAVDAYAKLSRRCRKVKEACIDACVDSDLPTGTYSGDPYHACVRECMERAKCW